MGINFYVKNESTGSVVCLQGRPSEYGLKGCEILSDETEYNKQRNAIYSNAVKSVKK
ncbi:MAG: hypothetical protein KAH32_08935 [Chlamydiia bacterium]|nr:hypothetical protein [Chlamydiia bacterium]